MTFGQNRIWSSQVEGGPSDISLPPHEVRSDGAKILGVSAVAIAFVALLITVVGIVLSLLFISAHVVFGLFLAIPILIFAFLMVALLSIIGLVLGGIGNSLLLIRGSREVSSVTWNCFGILLNAVGFAGVVGLVVFLYLSRF